MQDKQTAYMRNLAWLDRAVVDPDYAPDGEYNWVIESTFTLLCQMEDALEEERETLAEYKREVLPNYMTW